VRLFDACAWARSSTVGARGVDSCLPRLGAVTVRIRFLGSGEAFGAGGRFQTCIHLQGDLGAAMLLDCGASSLIAMKRASVEPTDIETVALTHLHGDHFGGLPFLILDGQFRRRERPLLVGGPPGTEERLRAAMEVLFPGSSRAKRRFDVSVVELEPSVPLDVGPGKVTAFPVEHASGAPAYALRVALGGKQIAYSGDTQWTETLGDAARGADVFVCEAYFFEKQVRYHLDYRTLKAHLHELGCKRIVLTHRSEDMLRRASEVDLECAEDGLTLEL
jgi:ribonuclease BN (tRNA processing enzyme)